ncbi:MAG: T9SS type A sorting domain-containing protein [Chitinophagales bacterium]
MKKYLIAIWAVLMCFKAGAQTTSWTAVLPSKFPTNVSGQIHGISRISQLKFHPSNPAKMYAVSARGGLFLSTDTGKNWTVAPGTDFMTYARLASVCIDPTDDQILYVGTGDHNYYYTGLGVLKSTNGGNTFSQIGLSGRLVIDMIMDPNDHLTIVAITDAGIYKTTNGGTTWTLKSATRAMDDLKQKTPTSRTLYAASVDTAFFRSSDFGDTWTQISTGITLPSGVTTGDGCRIALTPADTNLIYLGMIGNGGMLYKSTNGGNSFSPVKTAASPYLSYYSNVSSSSSQGDYNFGLGVDRLNPNKVYFVAHNVWRSLDGGSNWSQLTNWWQTCHTDMHQIFTSPYNNNKLYNMNDGGVWMSTDSGTNWTPVSDGIAGYEIYHGNCSPTRSDMISIGTQDNGELYANSTGWFTNRGGDWTSQCAFDYRTNSAMVYYYSSNKRRLVTGSEATYGLPAQVTQLHDIAFNRSNTALAFVADSFIYRSTNIQAGTPSWTQIAALGKKVMAMHSRYGDPNTLYIITNDATIYVSTNALAATPTFTSYSLPNSTNSAASITSIRSNPNVLYVTCNTKVYRSADNGSTWTNITFNLPSTNHIRILADEYYSNNELVFIASNNTVYYKVANANAWTIYDTGLPSRPTVIDLSFYNDSTANTLLRVATYGRGMWQRDISDVRALKARMLVDNNNPCTGDSVHFRDVSTGEVTTRNWTFPGGTPSTSTASNPVVTYGSSGAYQVILTVSNGVTTKSDTQLNFISTLGRNLPLVEGFESATFPPSGWVNHDNATAGKLWTRTTSAGGYGLSSASLFFDHWGLPTIGERDDIQTMTLDLHNYNSAKLTFDLAYRVFTGFLRDSLAVYVSTNCGSTFTKVYQKGGNTLSTAGTASTYFTPTASQWRTDTINLNAYLGQTIMLRFEDINGYSSQLYIDNINLNATVAVNAGRDTILCNGSGATIGSSAVSGLNYTWNPVIGLSASNTSDPAATPAVTTSYICTASHSLSGISNNDTVLVQVKSGANNATLPTTANHAVSLSEECTDNGWTYYADPADHSKWLFGIYKNGNTFTANVTLGVKSYPYDSVQDAPHQRAVYALSTFWNVTLSSGAVTNPVSVRFFFNNNDLDLLQSRAAALAASFPTGVAHAVEWIKTNNTAYSPALITAATIANKIVPNPTVVTGTLHGISYAEYQDLSGFSGGTAGIRISSNGAALPVKLLYLKAEAISNSYIDVSWATASEINNKGFELQRSTDALNFENIKWVNGAGNSNTTLTYQYNDKTVVPGTIYYYRLKALDEDGNSEYSNVVSASLFSVKGFVVEELRPNPAIREAYVNVSTNEEQTVSLMVYDLLGRMISNKEWKLSAGLNGATIDISGFSAGTYQVAIKAGNTVVTKKLSVVR